MGVQGAEPHGKAPGGRMTRAGCGVPEVVTAGEARVGSSLAMGSLIKKRRKRMRKKKHKKMLKRTRWQRRAGK